MRALLCLGLVFTLNSCFLSRSTVNQPLQPALFAKLEPGKSTAREVVALLGAPSEIVQLGTRSAYRYDFTNLKRSGFTLIIVNFLNEDTRADRAWLFFDAHDLLTHAGTTFDGAKAQYAMPWQDIHGD